MEHKISINHFCSFRLHLCGNHVTIHNEFVNEYSRINKGNQHHQGWNFISEMNSQRNDVVMI
ncbi:hypothetical protein DERF_005683 [Dermatophagoides farinae]|uniref:Uncharacterized protein n=1 Tax=Dermatophagoides farinae TaxID=6954 RepID=A0A922I643_DERFA|nr:hypothetical protein DERF_005683 [Dermatophagoides farinae]